MKKIILIFTVLALTCLSSECLAQKLTTQVVNYNGVNYTYNAVIDNATLPVGAIKKKSELEVQKDTITGQMLSHTDKDDISKKVSPRFAIATIVILSSNNRYKDMSWEDALTACAGHKEGDTKTNVWRVPTQRELMLIYRMKSELNEIDNNKFADLAANRYWSSTESSHSSVDSRCVNFSNGYVRKDIRKGNTIYVRCIRDL